MNSAAGLLRQTPLFASGVRQVAVPAAARTIATLSHVDYEETFLVETSAARDRTGEEWARVVLEGSPGIMRLALPLGWFALGLEIGSPIRSEHRVLGWEIRRSTPDFALLGANSRLGLAAELLFMRQEDTLLFAAFVKQENPIARSAWARIAPGHRRVVRYLLEQVHQDTTAIIDGSHR